jgi:apolipoprotein N-acyltransferase
MREYAGSWLFSLVFSGPGATLGAHWNFGNLGFGASVTPLAYLSRYVGLFGLSFVTALANLVLFRLIHKRWTSAVILLALASLSTLAFYQYQSHEAKVPVGLVSLKEADLEYAHNLGAQAGAPSKLFVFPEYSFYFGTATPEEQKRDLPKLITADGATVNAGLEHARLFTDHHSLITYRGQSGNIINEQQKSFLIPAGEYLPYWIEFVLRKLGLSSMVVAFNNMNQITPASSSEKVVDVHGLRVGTLSCSGVITPTFYRQLAAQGAVVLVNTAALNIFANSPVYSQQNRQIVRFQAIANAKPYLQATKSGPSYILDHNGTFLAEAPAGRTMVLTANITPGQQTTLYSQFGEWLIYVSLAGLGLLGLYVILPRRTVS